MRGDNDDAADDGVSGMAKRITRDTIVMLTGLYWRVCIDTDASQHSGRQCDLQRCSHCGPSSAPE